MVAHDGHHTYVGELPTHGVVVAHAKHGVRVKDLPPACDFAEREQGESRQLVVEDRSRGDVVDFLPERWDRIAPAFIGPLLEELNHLGGVFVDLDGVQGERHDEEVEDLAPLDGLLVLVDLSGAVRQDSIDSCDIHRRYFLSVGNFYIIA